MNYKLITFLALALLASCNNKVERQSIKERAEQGDADAQCNLGVMYANGEGVPEDDAEAVKWFRKAAEQGHADAQYNLGIMYAKGEGVPEDNVLAYMWLNISAASGDVEAKNGKEVVSRAMTREQIAEAQKLSREWKPRRSR
ncbi:MAG: tetratricopeptide repeat protein [Akkermansiaceae bacterium]|nr:tetratricopeptide repeat protein [Akkermansiaceae bacterium]